MYLYEWNVHLKYTVSFLVTPRPNLTASDKVTECLQAWKTPGLVCSDSKTKTGKCKPQSCKYFAYFVWKN